MNNRLYNMKNPAQGAYKKVLCVCSVGLLRSPTVAEVLSKDPYNFNTRSCGFDRGCALIPLDEILLVWADEIIVMDNYQAQVLRKQTKKPVINLQIGDNYDFRDPKLIQKIKENYKAPSNTN